MSTVPRNKSRVGNPRTSIHYLCDSEDSNHDSNCS